MAVVRLPSLTSRGLPLANPVVQRRRLSDLGLRKFDHALDGAAMHPLRPGRLDILQLNVGKLCNQTCRHCHVDAGPDRTEVMTRETMEHCLRVLDEVNIPTVDITGGAPELNPNFRWLVQEAKARGRHVMDRCNLTVLLLPKYRDLSEFLKDHEVEVVCSLPHYRSLSTDRQRGDGVFEKSIRALRRLNELGYAQPGTGLRLILVTNPAGAFLPGNQASLEAEWKRELDRIHGIQFDSLFTITNMPISRYLEWLVDTGNLEGYMEKLVQSFNPVAAEGAMCRTMLSVGWDGALYDCDFNQMLEMPLAIDRPHIRDFDLEAFQKRAIATDQHCFGCTAGAGSSCGGAVT
ncbi:MAG: arsenosugar biosynthesis radical SAM (seleno)protein ArsS [Myxococcota bacterium]